MIRLGLLSFPNYIVNATQAGHGPYLFLGPHDSRYFGVTLGHNRSDFFALNAGRRRVCDQTRD
jgi:hypothetical protein